MKYRYFAFLVLFVAAALNINAQKVIDIEIVSETEKYLSDKPVDVKITLTNVSDSPVKVLPYHTPVNGIEGDILSVSLNGKLVDYIGRLYKRPEPIDSDYITLGPGQSISGIASLWNNYDISASGQYAVQYNTAVLNEALNDIVPNLETVSSNVIYIDVEGRAPVVDPDEGDGDSDDGDGDSIVNGSYDFASCSSSEKSAIISARDNALNYADDSYDYLVLQPPGARYTTWFGTYNGARHSILRFNFFLIRDAIDNGSIKFFCGSLFCGSNTYAYVIPVQKNKVHLCSLFWSAPTTGTNSKAGTLIHELSHFLSIAGTNDQVYGHTAAMNLANTNPNGAIQNADNHEFFAEATRYNPYDPCAPLVSLYNGTQIHAFWEGANCQVMPVPAGAQPFIYQNSYYIQPFRSTTCPPPSSYDTANCYILKYPPQRWWFLRQHYFIYAGNLYITRGIGNSCPPPSRFDGANCYIMPLPPGTSPFNYAGNLYITPLPYCPVGYFDTANCYIGTPPASRKAFIYSSYFYYEH
jgi:peptidyl-Lys metalloendopeptidase